MGVLATFIKVKAIVINANIRIYYAKEASPIPADGSKLLIHNMVFLRLDCCP